MEENKRMEAPPKRGKGRSLTDLTGRRFGRLVALYPTKERDRKGSVYWHCVCDCGKEAEVTENGLVHGNNRSCGCLKRENQKRVVDQLHMVDETCLVVGKEEEQERQHQRVPGDLLPEKRALPGGDRV